MVLLLVLSAGANSPSPELSVGGTYSTRVTLLADSNTCGVVTVQDAPTRVTHTPGATKLSVTHAGNSYPGTIDVTGGFATTPAIVRGNGSEFTITITGRFRRRGFDATVRVAAQQPTPPRSCSYTVRWVGTKDGPPNVIP